jgi:hypothetical protein
MKKEVHDLKSLRERQEMLKLEMQISKEAFRNSVHKTKSKSGSFLVNYVLIPIGAGGIINVIMKNLNDREYQGEKPAWLAFAEQIISGIGEQFNINHTDDN